MGTFLVRRSASAAVTLFLALVVAFVLTRASGDPVRNMLGETASAEQVARVRADLGLDQPLYIQFVSYLGRILTGDFGTSLRYSASNFELIVSRIGATLFLAVAAVGTALVIGVVLGMIAAWRENSLLDRFVTVLAIISQSVPTFWLGLLLISLFAITLNWLPAGGAATPASIVLPALALSTKYIGEIARLTRSSMIDVMREKYISLAKVNGVSSARILVVHGLRNAAIPVVTLLGVSIGMLLSGSVAVEFVFAWPGIGSLIINAVSMRDFTLVQACVVLGAIVFVVINLLTDLMYGVIDPRVRSGSRA